MVWVYAVILAFSAGLGTYVLARTLDSLTRFLGVENPQMDVLSIAAFMGLAFLMVAQTPAMMLVSAFILWLVGQRHRKAPLSLSLRMLILLLAVWLGIAALGSPHFQLPEQLPKAAIMAAVYGVWALLLFLPVGAPSEGLIAGYIASLAVFVVGAAVAGLPLMIAGDAVVVMGALIGAIFAMRMSNVHEGLAGQWVFLYLLGFLAALSAYEGAWWLGLLGLAPVTLYTLVRRV